VVLIGITLKILTSLLKSLLCSTLKSGVKKIQGYN
jgi:hypothetical protein